MHLDMTSAPSRRAMLALALGAAVGAAALFCLPWSRTTRADASFNSRVAVAPSALATTTMTTVYTENFNGLDGGLPPGWTVRTGATASSLGTAATFSATRIDWGNTSGAFKNFASANNSGFNASTPAAAQNSAPDRALGIRQTGTFGDPGAAFTYQRDTTGETIAAISFDAQMLSVQPRSTTWTLQYGVGASPTSFVTLATYNDPGAWGNTNISVTLTPTQSAEVSNQPSVFFRVVALTDSSGSGARDSFGIDNFTLSSGGPPPTAPIVPSCPGAVSAFQGTTAVACGLSATDADSIVNNAVVFSVTPPTAGFSIVDFTPAGGVGGTATATLQIANTVPTGTYTVVVRWSNNDTPTPQTADCTITVNVVAATPVIAINQIQGATNTSPLVSTVQTTEGVVYGLRSNGFFIQTPDGSPLNDGDPNTSEGIFVFTGSAPPVQIGNLVRVRGTVAEFVPAADPQQPSVTQLSGTLTIARLACSAPLPAPTVITPTIAGTPSALEPALPLRYERFEGMRVQVNHLAVVSPTGGSVNETTATATTNGVFYGVVAEPCTSGFCFNRPFREPGIRFPDTVPNGGVTGTLPPPANVPRWDANPELIRVFSTGQPGTTALNVPAGNPVTLPVAGIVTNLIGAMDYAFRTFTILPEAANPPVFSNPGVPGVGVEAPLPIVPPSNVTIASMNLERFFDDRNDPGRSEPVLTPTAYTNRLNKFSLQVRNVLRNPDVIGLQEVEAPTDNLPVVINDMAARLNTDNGNPTNGNPSLPFYVGYIFPTNDVGGIAVAYLVNTNRITVGSVTQVGASDTYVRPDGSTTILNDRPPIILQGSLGSYAFTVINLHQRSLNDIATGGAPINGYPNEGYRVRHKRQLQAEFVANLIRQRQINNPNERMVVIGDFNGFQFNDGYTDIYNTILGNPPTPPASGANETRVVLAPTGAWNPPTPPLVSLTGTTTTENNYSFLFDGSAQTLDQVAVTPNVASEGAYAESARVNADFPEVDRNNPASPRRLSDHDPKRVVLVVPTATPVLQNCRVSLNVVSSGLSGNTCGLPNYAGDLVITSVLTNTSSQPISNVFVQVVGLGYPDSTPTGVIVASPNPHRLLTADGATCSSGGQAGANQSTINGQAPIGSNTPIGTLNPGDSRTLTFRIALPAVRRMRFFVNVFGVGGTACPVASNESRANGPVMATTTTIDGPALGFELLRDKGGVTVKPVEDHSAKRGAKTAAGRR